MGPKTLNFGVLVEQSAKNEPHATFRSARSRIGTRGHNLTGMKWRHGFVDTHGRAGMMW